MTWTWGFASTISEKTRSIKAPKCTRFSGEGPRQRTLRRFRAHWSKKFLLLFFLNSKEAETSRHKINERMRACILTVKAPQHIGKGQRVKGGGSSPLGSLSFFYFERVALIWSGAGGPHEGNLLQRRPTRPQRPAAAKGVGRPTEVSYMKACGSWGGPRSLAEVLSAAWAGPAKIF